MALFIYDLEQAADLQAEIAKARACRELTVQGVSYKGFRYNMRTLLNHKVVVLPSGLQHHTTLIERFKSIANLMPGTVTRPLCAHLEQWRRDARQRKTPSAADTVVPPVQQRAVADGPLLASA